MTPAGRGRVHDDPVEPHDNPVHVEQGASGSRPELPVIWTTTKFTQALGVLTDSLHDATPQLRHALDGVAALSRSINANDEALASLLERAKSVTKVLADRPAQVNQLVVDGNQLFAALDERRAALSTLIAGIQPAVPTDFWLRRRQPQGVRSGADEAQRGARQPAAASRAHQRGAASDCRRTPPRSARWSRPGPGFHINLLRSAAGPDCGEVLLDLYFQPGKLPDSLADYLRGFISERMIIRPKSP